MKIAYDTKLMRPACVIIQAALGCGDRLAHRFDSKDWLVNLTDNMHVYEINESQLVQLIAMTVQKRANPEQDV